ncbi:MAG: pyruvate dehydrogenase complex dihydrolipoamide acetyltransferase [Bacteroidetes bacterium]|nr:pyruvate dehydrogenase complex dihydrolipoamide acetyltransferase [Bacteroidota bacterium]
MAEIVRMPKLSDTMTDGVIAKWHKKVGDKVKSGELLADIETDKATMEFESFQDGVLLHIGVQEKQAVPVDSIIAILGKEGEDISALLKGGGETKGTQKTEEKIETAPIQTATNSAPVALPAGVEVIRMPKLSDTMTDGVIEKWHKKVGDKVKSGELLADIATDKATMEFESFQDGVLLHIGIQEKQSVPVDGVIAILGKGGEDVNAILKSIEGNKGTTETKGTVETKSTETTTISPSSNNSNPITNNSNDSRVKASPLAKALAKDKGIDISKVNGTGDNGRVTKSDIENYKPASTTSTGSVTAAGKSISSFVPGTEGFTDEPASQMRKVIAKRLLESTNGAPAFYLTIEVDMDNAMQSRNAINAIPDTKVSFNDLVIKACAAALRKHPKVNSSWMGDKIRTYSHVHIGVAVAVEDGLLVPVIRFADQKSLSQISAEVKDLGKRAKDKKLQPADWEGNTFTVSNLGMFGIDEFTSIINTPESCILSVGAIKQVPVVKNNQVVPGNVMKVTLACDHRTVDGATGAAFLQTLRTYLENPVTILA